ncbi:crossover junction endonuclease MUS81-like, partial [Gymnodraco acuticeps]|uniref:Crossover junction endonuclease MUS81 n=1 Tax=Gymnodraco acuticeps TaxID=8218 RepID=A0A6P8UVA1_GYMAC
MYFVTLPPVAHRAAGRRQREGPEAAVRLPEGPDAPIHSLPEGAPPAGRQDNNSLDPPRKKNAAGDQGKNKGGRKKREYVPQRRSGGYAVLLTLYRVSQIPGSKGYMFKMELQAEAQQLCDKSFSVPDLGSKYTAWSSVSTLIQKNLMMKTHNPARYSLTEEGLALGERLESLEGTKGPEGDREEARSEGNEQEEGEEGGPGIVDLTVSDDDEEEKEEERIQPTERPTSSASQPRVLVPGMFFSGKPRNVPSRNPKSWSLLPGSYEIILCVDFIETTGGSKNCKQDLVKELQRNGVTFDVRKLNVGDFLWVAREKVAPIPGQLRTPVGRELVLDYIIERKRMDDLCGSIIDGRFREQKFRLKRCGLRNPCYLVEECGKAASHLSLPESTLQQAIINTQNCTLTCRSRELE